MCLLLVTNLYPLRISAFSSLVATHFDNLGRYILHAHSMTCPHIRTMTVSITPCWMFHPDASMSLDVQSRHVRPNHPRTLLRRHDVALEPMSDPMAGKHESNNQSERGHRHKGHHPKDPADPNIGLPPINEKGNGDAENGPVQIHDSRGLNGVPGEALDFVVDNDGHGDVG